MLLNELQVVIIRDLVVVPEKPEFAAYQAEPTERMRGNETQKKLADKLNTKQAYISKVENGRVSPTISYIAKMADALNADAEIIFRPRGTKEVIKAVLVKSQKKPAGKTNRKTKE